MVAQTPPTSSRWIARLSLLVFVAAATILIGFAQLRLVAVGIVGVCVMVAAAYWVVSRRGVVRGLATAMLVLVPIAIVVVYTVNGQIWLSLLTVGLALIAFGLARVALRAAQGPAEMPTYAATAPKHAFIVMNPRSGGGKVGKFGLRRKAEALGAEVVMLDGPDIVDVAALARTAVANGCDLLGVAGGDGTQALVAGIAAEHDLPFLVISAGTRNHFALDLGLDRDDPSTCLDALTDGEELHIDLGVIGDRTFVNNASFGAYAEIVQSPAYREEKRKTTLEMMPDLLNGHHGARLTAHAGDAEFTAPQALLISNNPYQTTDVAGLGRRGRLDEGTLGIVSVRVDSTAQAIRLLRRGGGPGVIASAASEVIVTADTPVVPVGIDGETVAMATPVRCTIRPGALRVLVPRNRPGVPEMTPAVDLASVWRLAFVRNAATDRYQKLSTSSVDRAS